jgi:hypothetical protein
MVIHSKSTITINSQPQKFATLSTSSRCQEHQFVSSSHKPQLCAAHEVFTVTCDFTRSCTIHDWFPHVPQKPTRTTHPQRATASNTQALRAISTLLDSSKHAITPYPQQLSTLRTRTCQLIITAPLFPPPSSKQKQSQALRKRQADAHWASLSSKTAQGLEKKKKQFLLAQVAGPPHHHHPSSMPRMLDPHVLHPASHAASVDAWRLCMTSRSRFWIAGSK